MVLTKHVIRRDHKIIGSCDFVCKSPSSYHPAKLCARRYVGT